MTRKQILMKNIFVQVMMTMGVAELKWRIDICHFVLLHSLCLSSWKVSTFLDSDQHKSSLSLFCFAHFT